MAYFENYTVTKTHFDAIKDRVTYKNLVIDEKTGYYEADFEYFAFRRASVKEGFMRRYDLPAVDLIEQYNKGVDINFKDLLDTINYQENNLAVTLEQVEEEVMGIEWLISKLEEHKDKLEDIAHTLKEEQILADQ